MQEVQIGNPEIAVLFIQLIKALFKYLIIPSLVIIISAVVVNFFLNKRSIKKIISVLQKDIENKQKDIDKKVDIVKFDASVARIHNEREKGDAKLHQRVDEVKDIFNKNVTEIKESLSYIRGFVIKNNKQ